METNEMHNSSLKRYQEHIRGTMNHEDIQGSMIPTHDDAARIAGFHSGNTKGKYGSEVFPSEDPYLKILKGKAITNPNQRTTEFL